MNSEMFDKKALTKETILENDNDWLEYIDSEGLGRFWFYPEEKRKEFHDRHVKFFGEMFQKEAKEDPKYFFRALRKLFSDDEIDELYRAHTELFNDVLKNISHDFVLSSKRYPDIKIPAGLWMMNNPKELLKSPRIILDAKLEDIIKFGKEYPDIFGKVLMKVPGVLEKFPENQRKTIHDGFVKGFNKIFKEDPTLVTLFPKSQQAEIMKMHPSVWSPKDTTKLAGSLFLTERLDKVASQLEKKGYIKEAYEIDTISNELESFWAD